MARTRILAACVLWAALPALSLAQVPSTDPVPLGNVADKLGVKTMVNAPRELDLGHSVTTMLADPKKLTPYNRGTPEGARGRITCVGPNRLRVEAEEMEPVEQLSAITLHVGEDGSLTPVQPVPPRADKPPAS